MTRAMTPGKAGVLGIGVDLVETARLKQSLKKWGSGFKNRVFLPKEQAYCDAKAAAWQHYAGRFAVKEAVTKAFGTGVGRHIGWLDIEVLRDGKSGAPSVRLSPKGRILARKHGVANIWISLAHTRNYAMAQAVLVGAGRSPTRKKS
jgi:holo-[acyl-carrier protein] synthase